MGTLALFFVNYCVAFCELLRLCPRPLLLRPQYPSYESNKSQPKKGKIPSNLICATPLRIAQVGSWDIQLAKVTSRVGTSSSARRLLASPSPISSSQKSSAGMHAGPMVQRMTQKSHQRVHLSWEFKLGVLGTSGEKGGRRHRKTGSWH